MLFAELGLELIREELEKELLILTNLIEHDMIAPKRYILCDAVEMSFCRGPTSDSSAIVSSETCLEAASKASSCGSSASTGHPATDQRKYLCAVLTAVFSSPAQHRAISA